MVVYEPKNASVFFFCFFIFLFLRMLDGEAEQRKKAGDRICVFEGKCVRLLMIFRGRREVSI